MNEQQFLRALRLIVDGHIDRLTCVHNVLMHSTAALTKVAQEHGLSNEMIRAAMEEESDRVDEAMDRFASAATQAQNRSHMH